jgi:hypothetical protein
VTTSNFCSELVAAFVDFDIVSAYFVNQVYLLMKMIGKLCGQDGCEIDERYNNSW